MLIAIWATMCSAESVSQDQIRQISEQVQGIKSDVLGIANSLIQLEERSIYPDESRVSVFVTFADGEDIPLGKVRVRIDGKEAVLHTYSPGELVALKRGGAQRVYTGNVSSGRHQLEVAVIDNDKAAGDDLNFEIFRFYKFMSPKVIEISLAGKTFGKYVVNFRE